MSACCPWCVSPFSRTGRCARSHRTGLCQHAFPKEETLVRRRRINWTHTSPTSACCRTRIPSHLLSPDLLGNQGRVSKVCQSLPRRPLRQRVLCTVVPIFSRVTSTHRTSFVSTAWRFFPVPGGSLRPSSLCGGRWPHVQSFSAALAASCCLLLEKLVVCVGGFSTDAPFKHLLEGTLGT